MSSDHQERRLPPVLLKGLARKCPRCGESALFSGYLSVRESCDVCDLEFHHHRADDMPTWMTILIVGHIVVPLMLTTATGYNWPDWVHMTLWPALVLILSLTILPFAKGFVIALQWGLRMHGFSRYS